MKKLPVDPLFTGIVDQAWLTRHAGVDSYPVFPSIYTVIGFQFSGRIHHVGENRALSTFGVTGILDTRRMFRSDASTQSPLALQICYLGRARLRKNGRFCKKAF